jgi:hypothetical protein
LDGGSDPDVISEEFYNQNANEFGYLFGKLNHNSREKPSVSLVGANGSVNYKKIVYLPITMAWTYIS